MQRLARLHEALDYAAEVHKSQRRKGTEIPYLAHPIGVCSLVLDFGGDEAQAMAGLLHDVIEDGGPRHRADIRTRFGDRVADIVEGCTDRVPDESGAKPPWRARKEAYLSHLPHVDADTLLVSACDKLHNARAIAADVRTVGRAVFDRFNAGRDDTLWYYRGLCEVFAARLGADNPLVIELGVALAAMEL